MQTSEMPETGIKLTKCQPAHAQLRYAVVEQFPRENKMLGRESPLSAVSTATLFRNSLLAAYEDSILVKLV
jgi:hypothetical protein